MNATTPHWSLVNIGSGNGLVPSGNKPLPEPMLTQICHHMASLCHNVLRVTISPLNSQEISLMFYNAVIAISTTEHLNAAARQQTLSSYTDIHPTLNMMMSSNGNIFHITGPLCGEFTGDWWIPSQRLRKQLWHQWFEMPLHSSWCHCNDNGLYNHLLLQWWITSWPVFVWDGHCKDGIDIYLIIFE